MQQIAAGPDIRLPIRLPSNRKAGFIPPFCFSACRGFRQLLKRSLPVSNPRRIVSLRSSNRPTPLRFVIPEFALERSEKETSRILSLQLEIGGSTHCNA
jgi:hypothetical protein